MMHGSQSIENAAVRWSRFAQAANLRATLFNLAVGVVAGVIGAHVRLHMGLSGHKIVFWLVPVLAARLMWRSPLGATMGAVGAMGASFVLGGNLAGGIPYMAFLALAGGVIDGAVAFAHTRSLSPVLVIPLLGFAGVAANLLCAIKRLLMPVHNHSLLLGMPGPLGTIVSYAMFGLLAGLLGAALGLAGAKLASRPDKRP